jgi:schlafen family protein
MSAPKFVSGRKVNEDESRTCEFKEVKSPKPLDVIRNAVDEYAVAYLNSNCGGKIYWGIRNDGVVLGVELSREDRDKLRRVVVEQLQKIQPTLAPSTYGIELYPVAAAEGATSHLDNVFVVEVTVFGGTPKELYFTCGNEAFIKTDAGKRKLNGTEISAEIHRRQHQAPSVYENTSVAHVVPQISVSYDSGDVEGTDESVESAIYDILFNIDSKLEPAFFNQGEM